MTTTSTPMIIDPSLLDHPKFHHLVRTLGARGAGRNALTYLVRIWGHCQMGQRGGDWGEVSPEWVECVAKWDGDSGELFKALISSPLSGKPGFIEMVGKRVIIHDWDEHNKSLISRWSAGKLGGRPAKTDEKPSPHPRLTGEKPKVNHKDNLLISDKRGEDKRGIEGRGESRIRPPEDFGNEVNVPPSLAEVIAYGARLEPPCPEDVATRFWRHHQANHWQGGRILDFRPALCSWWETDLARSAAATSATSLRAVSADHIEACLATETDPEMRAELRRQLRSLEPANSNPAPALNL